MALAAGTGSVESQGIDSSLLDVLRYGAAPSLDLDNPAASTYLSRLLSLPLESLVQEPHDIATESLNVDSELVNLCYREYPTFVSVHKCSAAVSLAFNDFESSLAELVESIPALEQECRDFSQYSNTLQRRREKAILVQEHQDRFMDMLEIPHLMETCVRNGYYQEAFELATHTETLQERFNSVIVNDLVDEVQKVLGLLSSQLVALLRDQANSPTLIKSINYLRRLNYIGEAQLGALFLSSRLHHFRAALVAIERERTAPARYVRQYIDLFREHVYDIVMQFSTIFPNSDYAELSSFTSLCVEDLVQLVTKYVPRMANDSAALSSTLIQLGYCSQSFARLGLDFGFMFVDVFEDIVKATFRQGILGATDTLCAVFESAVKNATTPTDLLVTFEHLQSILLADASPPTRPAGMETSTPPASWSGFPLLAKYVNAHLSGINALRLLAPTNVFLELQAVQADTVRVATGALMNYITQAIPDDASQPHRSTFTPKHVRTPSSPRAHLLRRNTETQLSLETRAARRREAARTCVAFCDAWIQAQRFLHAALASIFEVDSVGRGDHLDSVLADIDQWVNSHSEGQSVAEADPISEQQPVGKEGSDELDKSNLVSAVVLPPAEEIFVATTAPPLEQTPVSNEQSGVVEEVPLQSAESSIGDGTIQDSISASVTSRTELQPVAAEIGQEEAEKLPILSPSDPLEDAESRAKLSGTEMEIEVPKEAGREVGVTEETPSSTLPTSSKQEPSRQLSPTTSPPVETEGPTELVTAGPSFSRVTSRSSEAVGTGRVTLAGHDIDDDRKALEAPEDAVDLEDSQSTTPTTTLPEPDLEASKPSGGAAKKKKKKKGKK